MKHLFLFSAFIIVFTFNSIGQDLDTSFANSISRFQKSLNDHYKSKDHSPLTKKQRKKFKGHNFYPVNEKYLITAKFILTPNTENFKMKTTTERRPIYRKYGEVHFDLDGKTHILSIYQNIAGLKSEKYKNDLFLLFNDKTNGNGSYYGGRYIDLKIPTSDTLIIDFNKSYNPYCHYNSAYSCPIPPSENLLDIEIEAGIKSYGKSEQTDHH